MAFTSAGDFTYAPHEKPEKIWQGWCGICKRWTGVDAQTQRLHLHGPGVESRDCMGSGQPVQETRSIQPKLPSIH